MSEHAISSPSDLTDSQNPADHHLPEGWLRVNALDIDAQGIARRPDGKVVFIEGALPYEVVSVQVSRKRAGQQAQCGEQRHAVHLAHAGQSGHQIRCQQQGH